MIKSLYFSFSDWISWYWSDEAVLNTKSSLYFCWGGKSWTTMLVRSFTILKVCSCYYFKFWIYHEFTICLLYYWKCQLFTICTADQPCVLLIMCRMDCLLFWESHLVITSNITSVSGSTSSWFKLNLWKSYMPIKYNNQLCRYLVLSHLWSSNRLD